MLKADLDKIKEKIDLMDEALNESVDAYHEIEEINASIERVGEFAQEQFHTDLEVKQKVMDCLVDLFFEQVDFFETKIRNEIDNLKERI